MKATTIVAVKNQNKSGIRIEGCTCRGIVDAQENFIFIAIRSHALDLIWFSGAAHTSAAQIQVLADAEDNFVP